jgi:hypothetical protein
MMARALRFVLLVTIVAVGLPQIYCGDEMLRSTTDIERLALSIALADFPMEQGRMADLIGTPRYSPMKWGSKVNDGPDYQMAALTDPKSSTGFYALRFVYKNYNKLPPAAKIEVVSLEIIFIAPNLMCFVHEQNPAWVKILPDLKAKMKKMGLKPREFAALFYKLAGP